MALFVWNEKLSVNIKSIDEQHKKLIDMINDFYDNIAKRPNSENMSKLLGSMKDYIQVHFKYEENYMKQYGYEFYESHKSEHDFFVSKVAEVEERLNKGKMVLSLEITIFLKDWLIKHIQIADKKYSEYFIAKGLK